MTVLLCSNLLNSGNLYDFLASQRFCAKTPAPAPSPAAARSVFFLKMHPTPHTLHSAHCTLSPEMAAARDRPGIASSSACEAGLREIGILLPNNQRQHRSLHIQKDVLPYALW
jgi:hypothetical protein